MAVSIRLSFAASAASFFVLTALLVPTADGADKKSTAPTPASKTPLLSPAQLRDCLARKDKVARDNEALARRKAELGAVESEIASAGQALKEEATTLDSTSADAVAAHNAKVIDRNTRIDAHQARVTAYNTDAQAALAAKEALEKACANRSYDDRDLLDLQRKK